MNQVLAAVTLGLFLIWVVWELGWGGWNFRKIEGPEFRRGYRSNVPRVK